MKNYCEKFVECPHCGHSISMTIDATNGNQEFYDECPACYCSVDMTLEVDEQHETLNISVDGDDEQIF